MYITKEKVIWGFLIIGLMIGIYYHFSQSRLIPTSQTFGPIPTSELGGAPPFNDIELTFSCTPNGAYFSEDSDISCKFFAKPKKAISYDISITAKIYSIDNNRLFLNCTSSISSAGYAIKNEGYCKDSEGDKYFELPRGDYTISASEFTSNNKAVTIIKSKAVQFRGTLHIMSSYEKTNKQVEDGVSTATFLAFLFIIPTAIIEIRRFLHEKL